MPRPEPPGKTTPAETIAEILRKSQRKRGVPVRRGFVQRGRAGEGPLAGFVHRHDVRGLDLYLLSLLLASHEPWKVALPAATLSRALGWGDKKSGQVAVSRAYARLEQQALVRRSRGAGHTEVTILREDGSGDEYTRPTGSTSTDFYLQVPLAYWTEEWHLKLALAGKLALLIGLTRNRAFSLPTERAPGWYGISADTLERGFADLRRRGLLNRRRRWMKQPLSAMGWVWEYEYLLKGPFQPKRRRIPEEEVMPLRVISNASA